MIMKKITLLVTFALAFLGTLTVSAKTSYEDHYDFYGKAGPTIEKVYTENVVSDAVILFNRVLPFNQEKNCADVGITSTAETTGKIQIADAIVTKDDHPITPHTGSQYGEASYINFTIASPKRLLQMYRSDVVPRLNRTNRSALRPHGRSQSLLT